LNDIIKRDKRKEKMCFEKGITLVFIPYWYVFIIFKKDKRKEKMCFDK
jgi:hypothetical protein